MCICSVSLCRASSCLSAVLKLDARLIEAGSWWSSLLCLPWLGIGGNDLQVCVRSVSVVASSSWSTLLWRLSICWALRFFDVHQLLTAKSLQPWLNGLVLYRLLILHKERFVTKIERVEHGQLKHLILLSIERFGWAFHQNIVIGLFSELKMLFLLTRWAFWPL